MLPNVTVKTISEVTGLNKTDASAFLRLMVKQGHATESGNRKNLASSDAGYIVMRGRPSITFDVDSMALAGYVGADKASKIADSAAQEAATYTANLAHAELAAKTKREEAAKQAKVKGLEAQLAAIRGETGDVF